MLLKVAGHRLVMYGVSGSVLERVGDLVSGRIGVRVTDRVGDCVA